MEDSSELLLMGHKNANIPQPFLKTSLEHLRIKKVESSDEEDSEDD